MIKLLSTSIIHVSKVSQEQAGGRFFTLHITTYFSLVVVVVVVVEVVVEVEVVVVVVRLATN